MIEIDDRYSNLMRAGDDAIYVLDAQGRLHFMNHAAAAQLGGKPADYVGKSVRDVFVAEQADLFANYVRQVIQTRKGIVTETRQLLQGQWRWHRTIVEPLHDSDGQVSTAFMMARDITELKHATEALAESETRYRALLEQIPVVTYAVKLGPQRTTQYVSSQITESLGYAPADAYTDPDHWQKHLHPEDRNRVLAELRQALKSGQSFFSEYRVIAKDGQVKWFSDRTSFVRNPDGQAQSLQGVMLDITPQKSAQNAARRSDEMFRQLFACSPIGMSLYDPDGKLVDVNRAAREMLGTTVPPVNSDYRLLNDPQMPVDARSQLLAGESVRFETNYDFDLVRKAHVFETSRTGVLQLDALITPLSDGQPGANIGFLVQAQDITQRKRAEAELQGLASQRQLALDAAGMGWWYFDIRTEHFSWDDRTRAIFDLDGSTACRDEVFSRIHPDDFARVRDVVGSTLTGPSPHAYSVEYRIHHRNGAEIWIENYGGVRFEEKGESRIPIGVFGTIRDITRRKRAEETLRRNEQQAHERSEELKTLMDLVPMAILVAHREGESLTIRGNRESSRIFEIPAEEAIFSQEQLKSFVPPRRFFRDGKELTVDDMPLHVAVMQGIGSPNVELDVLLANGRQKTIVESACPLYDSQGRIRGAISAVLDITDRKRAEIALRESREDFDTVLQSLRDIVWAATADGRRFLYINAAVPQVYGRPKEEFIADPDVWRKVIFPDDRTRLDEAYADFLASGQMDSEYRILRPDGTIRWVHDRKSMVRDPAGNPLRIGGIVSDITSQKQAEERNLRYEHDLRSLTHQILQVEETERRQLATDLHDGLTQILSLIKIKLTGPVPDEPSTWAPSRIGEVRSLLDQALREARVLSFELYPPVLHELGLPPAVRWLAEEMNRRFGLKVLVEDDDWSASLPESMQSILFRCVRELLINVAKHAHARQTCVRLAQTDRAVLIRVSDDGIGFKAGFALESLGSAAGQAGFGLFSMKQRLEHLGGSLSIQSQPAHGSVVDIVFPLNASDFLSGDSL